MTLTMPFILLTIVSSILSGIVGVIISTYYYKKSEQRRIKVDTAKRLFANRFDITGDEFSRALNEVFVVFHDSTSVMKSFFRMLDIDVMLVPVGATANRFVGPNCQGC